MQGVACTKVGVCGKSNTLAMQNLLVYALRGMAVAALAAKPKGDLENEKTQVNISNLKTGTYRVVISNNGETTSKNLIVK